MYRLPVTGGRAQSLTQDSGIALNYHPRISPDGRTIVFVSDRAGNDNLWLMDADGSNPRPLLLDSRSRMVEPVWLPDGTGVLFTRLHVTSYGIYRSEDRLWKVTLDGQAEPLLEKDQPAGTGRFAGSERLSWPSVTPDGRQVYFGRADFDGSNREVHRLDLANGNRDRVTPGDLSETCCASSAVPDITGVAAPEVSPDGRFLAFVRKLPGVSVRYGDIELDSATGLWVRDLQTGQERLLMSPITPDLMNQHPPWQVRVVPGYDWAADGESIFLSEGGGIRRVWLETGAVETIEFVAEVRRSISEQARRVGKLDTQPRPPRLIRWPTLSEDGQWLAYAAAGDVWLESVSGLGRPEGAAGRHCQYRSFSRLFSRFGATGLCRARWRAKRGIRFRNRRDIGAGAAKRRHLFRLALGQGRGVCLRVSLSAGSGLAPRVGSLEPGAHIGGGRRDPDALDQSVRQPAQRYG